jgi:hypothetical protein
MTSTIITTLTLTREQLNTVSRACQIYARVVMGQFWALRDLIPEIEASWDCIDLEALNATETTSVEDKKRNEISIRDKLQLYLAVVVQVRMVNMQNLPMMV